MTLRFWSTSGRKRRHNGGVASEGDVRLEMDFVPVRQTKAYEVIAQRLKEAIVSGKYAPGERLPSVRELSQQLGVGQAAVREALTTLRGMNLVTMRQGEGTFVNRYNPDELRRVIDNSSAQLMRPEDIRHLLELRKLVEAGTAQMAAQRRTDEDLKSLRDAVSRMEKDVGEPTLGEEADWLFHYRLAVASGNPYLVSLMDAISERIRTALEASRAALYRIDSEPERLLRQHRAVLEAVDERDPARAEACMLAHLVHVETSLKL